MLSDQPEVDGDGVVDAGDDEEEAWRWLGERGDKGSWRGRARVH